MLQAKKDFKNKVKQGLSKAFSLNEDQIQIRALEKGSVSAICFIQNVHRKQIEEIDLKELKELFPNSKPEIQVHGLFDQVGLSASDFDPRYHMVWDNFGPGDYDLRGPKSNPMKYFFPYGQRGYALNVGSKYGKNDDWLRMNGNESEWYILFHGTEQKFTKQIVQEGLKEGRGQAYQNDYCIRTKQRIGTGVYFSNHIEVCRGYARPTTIGDYGFYIAFQSRVNPVNLKQAKKASDIKNKFEEYSKINKQSSWSMSSLQPDDWNNDYFVVNNASDIRPYRILLYKEPKSNQ